MILASSFKLIIILEAVMIAASAFGCSQVGKTLRPITTQEGKEVVLILEYGRIFLGSPNGGDLYSIPYDGDIYLVRGSQTSATVFVMTRDEQHRLVYKQLALDGNIIQTYPELPQGHGITVPSEGDCLPSRELMSPSGLYRAYWKQSKKPPNSEWQLYVQELKAPYSMPPTQITTRGLEGYGLLNLLHTSLDSEWLIWGERNDRGWLRGRDRFYHFVKVRPNGRDLQEIEFRRPLWHRLKNSVWPLEELHIGYPFDIQWWAIPSSR